MRIRNPLATSSRAGQLSRFARLHVLLRDAYHSDPSVATAKLDNLEALRIDALATLPTIECRTEGQIGYEDPTAAPDSGVRLLERLRYAMGILGNEETPQTRRRIVFDLLFSIAPASEDGWARHPEPLIADTAALFGLAVSGPDLARLTRAHRASQRALWHTVRHRGASAVTRNLGDPHEALADAIGATMCLNPEAALATSVALVRTSRHGETLPGNSVAGGIILDRLDDTSGSAIDRFVGTGLARTSLPALIHHLASLEMVANDDFDARVGVTPMLRSLRADMLSAGVRDDAEAATLSAAAHVVEAARHRIENRDKPRLSTFAQGRHGFPRQRTARESESRADNRA